MTHLEVNSSTNINDILYFSGLIDNRITFQNHSRPEGDGMANGRKTICVTLYLETKSLKTVLAKYCKRFDFSNFPHKFQITCCVKKFKDTGTLIKSTKKGKLSTIGRKVTARLPENIHAVQDSVAWNLKKSLWRHSQEFGLSCLSIHRISKNNLQLYSYIIQIFSRV